MPTVPPPLAGRGGQSHSAAAAYGSVTAASFRFGVAALQSVLFLQHMLNGLLDGHVLPVDRARAVADLLARRHRQSRPRRVLCDRRLPDARALARRLASAASIVASPIRSALLGVMIERTLFRRFYSADPILSLLLTFGLAMVAEQALRMIFGAPPLSYSIPQGCAGQLVHRQLHLFVSIACCCSASPPPASRACGCCCSGPRSDASCAPACRTPTWSARSASRCSPTCRRWRALGIGLAGLAGVLLAPIYLDPPGDGPGDHNGGLRRGGDRRPRIVLGRRGGCDAGRVGERRHGRASAIPRFSTAAIYLLMLLVLLFRPRGLFGERIQRFE